MRLIAAVIVVVFIVSALPVFAADKPKTKSLFQQMSDSINGANASFAVAPIMKEKRHQFRPALKKVSTFQNLSNYIKEGSAKAKNKSARKKK